MAGAGLGSFPFLSYLSQGQSRQGSSQHQSFLPSENSVLTYLRHLLDSEQLESVCLTVPLAILSQGLLWPGWLPVLSPACRRPRKVLLTWVAVVTDLPGGETHPEDSIYCFQSKTVVFLPLWVPLSHGAQHNCHLLGEACPTLYCPPIQLSCINSLMCLAALRSVLSIRWSLIGVKQLQQMKGQFVTLARHWR